MTNANAPAKVARIAKFVKSFKAAASLVGAKSLIDELGEVVVDPVPLAFTGDAGNLWRPSMCGAQLLFGKTACFL